SKVATSSLDGTVIIWDASTGKRIHTLICNNICVNEINWSPDGNRIVTAGGDSNAIVWEVSSGEKLFTLSEHTASIIFAKWSDSYNKIITIGYDDKTIIWNANTGEKQFTLKGGYSDYSDYSTFNQIQYQNKVITFFYDTVAIWDINTGEILQKFINDEEENGPICASLSPDGSKIAISIYDKQITIYDATTGIKINSLQKVDVSFYKNIHWSPDSKKLMASDGAFKFNVWDVESCSCLFSYEHLWYIKSLYWSPNGDRIISVSNSELNIFSSSTFNLLFVIDDKLYIAKWSNDGKKIAAYDRYGIFIYNSENGTKLYDYGYHDPVNDPVWAPDGKKILTDGKYIWDAKNGDYLYKIDIDNHSISDSKLSPDGTKIAIAESYLKTNIWDFLTGEKLITLNFNNEITKVDWSNDGKRILSSNYYHTATVWDAITGDSLFTITGRINKLYGSIENACWNPNASKISSKLKDTLFIWDGNNGTLLLTIFGANQTIKNYKWSPDGKKIATIGGLKDSIAYVFDAITGNKLLTLSGHKDMLFDINWSPDGSKIVTASDDSTAIIWDANTGNKIFTLKGHNGLVFIANWSPDGNSVFTSGGSKSIIWDANTGNQKYQLKGLRNTVEIANWSPDGSRILTKSSNDMTAKVWYTDINSSIEENEIEKQNSVSVFPNPTENILNIKLAQILTAPLKLEIFDMLGSSIAESFVSEGTNDFQMDISNLSKGMYFLKINNEIQKIVKY
ncbi:MAG TPA: T9SS type A sorting domain-containing protein, partial [Candidatus Kapabacteria bacterium]|nr:T9SS type A sorting domain-containing protein [Candidatus Kapabacteria bacterium]